MSIRRGKVYMARWIPWAIGVAAVLMWGSFTLSMFTGPAQERPGFGEWALTTLPLVVAVAVSVFLGLRRIPLYEVEIQLEDEADTRTKRGG